jgi:atypical dual specificity phosphatase
MARITVLSVCIAALALAPGCGLGERSEPLDQAVAEPIHHSAGEGELANEGTGSGSDPVAADSAENAAAPADPAFAGFSWVVPGHLAAMPLPGRQHALKEDVAFLEDEGIRLLISLTETPTDSEVLEDFDIGLVHIPIRDFTAPTPEQIAVFVAAVEASVTKGDPVGVHCTAGLGRSGTMAAAYLVARGASASHAITTLRQLRPGSIETELQEEAVKRYEEFLSQK